MTTTENQIIIKSRGNKGIMILNRPKVMNVVNLPMLKQIYYTLKKWETEKMLVLIKAFEGKAFCAGGDMKNFAPVPFEIKDEMVIIINRIVSLIESYKIPYIALVDGYAMGTGMGLSVFSKYCVVTEKAEFAMPEARFGYHPNAGASFFLSRLRGKLGMYLALTAQRLKGADGVREGLATHYCRSENLKSLEEGLLNCSAASDIKHVLDEFSEKVLPEFSLAHIINKINYCFSARTVEEIVTRLGNDESDWARITSELIKQMSPTCLKVIFKQMTLGKQMKVNECLDMEYKITRNIFRRKEYLQGVQAIFLTKLEKLNWMPPTLSEVSDELVDGLFLENYNDDEEEERIEQ